MVENLFFTSVQKVLENMFFPSMHIKLAWFGEKFCLSFAEDKKTLTERCRTYAEEFWWHDFLHVLPNE